MEDKSSCVKSFETESHPTRGLLSLLLAAILINPGISNPHQPLKITWKLSNRQTHEVINETSRIHPLNTQWPDLYFNLRRLFLRRVGLHTLLYGSLGGHMGDTYAHTYGVGDLPGFFVCPGNIRDNWKTCGGMESYYCASWSCVTLCNGPRRWDVGYRGLVKFTFSDSKHQRSFVWVQFNQDRAKKESRWTAGLTWDLQLHVASYPGELLTTKQVIELVQVHSLGPNLVKTALRHKTTPKTTTSGPDLPRSNSTSSTPGTGGNLTNTPGHLSITASSVTQDPIWTVLNTAFMALNYSDPNVTQHC